MTIVCLLVIIIVQSNGLPLSGSGGKGNGLPLSGSGGNGNGNVEYLQQLQALNIGVSKWISGHVEKNPHVDLTPIFRDYEKHLRTIDMKVHVYVHVHVCAVVCVQLLCVTL